MRKALIFVMLLSAGNTFACEGGLTDQTFRKLASEERVNLCETYPNQVMLVVNTASKCGNTPQYDGLERLYETYSEQGLVVLGFPSNEFLGQEPGTEAEIQEFCRLTYGVQFPMFEKTTVRGDDANPFFAGLKDASGTYPQWNFHKYLIGRDGELISEFSPRTQPDDPGLVEAIEGALN